MNKRESDLENAAGNVDRLVGWLRDLIEAGDLTEDRWETWLEEWQSEWANLLAQCQLAQSEVIRLVEWQSEWVNLLGQRL